jgi:hypothetical protein
MGAVAQLSQLSLRVFAVAQCAARIERCCCAPKLRHGPVALAGLGERSARERS